MVGFFPSLLGLRCLGCGCLLHARGRCASCAFLESDRRLEALMTPPAWVPLPVSIASLPMQVLSLGRYENIWRGRIAAAKGWPAASDAGSWCSQWLAQTPAAWRTALWVAVPPRPLQGWHLVEELALALGARGVDASTSLLRWRWRAAALGTRQKSSSRLQRLAARERFTARRAPLEARSIVLFDDVTTTGATLSEAARVLSEQGWDILGAVVLAHTPAHYGNPHRVGLPAKITHISARNPT